MFSEKRGAELVLYKLKKTLPIGSGFCLLPIGRVFLYKYVLGDLLCHHINAFCRLRLEAQCVGVAAP